MLTAAVYCSLQLKNTTALRHKACQIIRPCLKCKSKLTVHPTICPEIGGTRLQLQRIHTECLTVNPGPATAGKGKASQFTLQALYVQICRQRICSPFSLTLEQAINFSRFE